MRGKHLPCNKCDNNNSLIVSRPFMVYRDCPFDQPSKSKTLLDNNCWDTIVQRRKLRLRVVSDLPMVNVGKCPRPGVFLNLLHPLWDIEAVWRNPGNSDFYWFALGVQASFPLWICPSTYSVLITLMMTLVMLHLYLFICLSPPNALGDLWGQRLSMHPESPVPGVIPVCHLHQ